MGGEREKVLDVSKPSSTGISIGTSKNPIRMHENQGEVHFHDDKAKLKVAVPCEQFWKDWQAFQRRIIDPHANLTFYDESRGTAVTITPDLNVKKGNVRAHVSIKVDTVELSPALKDMIDFARGK
jgi:hypothetical protein